MHLLRHFLFFLTLIITLFFILSTKKIKQTHIYCMEQNEITKYKPISSVTLPRTNIKLRCEQDGKIKDYSCVSVLVGGPDHEMAQQAVKDWSIANDTSRRWCPHSAYYGLAAEIAFAHVCGLLATTGKAEHGIPLDFGFGTSTIDVKARVSDSRQNGYANLLIESGTNLKCDYYLASNVIKHNKYNDRLLVCLVGYIYKNDIPRKKHIGKVGNHTNYEVPYEMLSPIQELIDRIKKHGK